MIRVGVGIKFRLGLTIFKINSNLNLTYLKIRLVTSDVASTRQKDAKEYLPIVNRDPTRVLCVGAV